MKKVLAVVLSLCLMVGLCSCSSAPIKVKKFASEAEMQEHLQGVWGYGSLYFIDGNQLYYEYSGVEGRVNSYEDSLADVFREQGAEGVSKLAVKDHLAQIEKSWLSVGDTLQFNHKKGTITYVEDGVEQVIYVGENVIFTDTEIDKLSDTPSYTCDELIGPFEEAHKNFKPTTSMYRLNAKEYAEVLRNKYFTTVTQDGSTVHMEYGSKEINYDTSKDLLTVSDRKMSTSMETLVADALLVFGDAPDVPSAGELVERFHNEAKTELHTTPTGSLYTTKTLVIDLDDAELKIHQDRTANNDGFDIVTIRF